MVLVNKKMLAGGMAMVIVGLVFTININAAVPVGQAGMTEEEKLDLLLAEQENEDYKQLHPASTSRTKAETDSTLFAPDHPKRGLGMEW